MFDVFTEEIEVIIKDGLANLYWYKRDLKKCWMRYGVPTRLCDSLFALKDLNGNQLTKRRLMDSLYEELRTADYNRRLEISRNFVRVLVEHKSFVPQDPKHRIEIAERSALKLREIIEQQNKKRELQQRPNRQTVQSPISTYYDQLNELSKRFNSMLRLEGQERGYNLEKLFVDLMKISSIVIQEPFKINGEQIDGAIKYDGRYYLIELKWVSRKCNQADIASLYLKADGKLDARGIFVAMEGYSSEVLESISKGKELKVLLVDGVHLANVINGIYTFQELLDQALKYASLRGEIYSPHRLD